VKRRGDDIPPVSDYAHWNEDAKAVWYLENRYDMEHWDEEVDEEDDLYPPPYRETRRRDVSRGRR
jgi:hypothetical protein